jgi:aryl-alcohol dehydrogenase-like predicted oxidoreductase
MIDRSRDRLATGRSMLELCRARALIALVPFGRWRDRLGLAPVPADARHSAETLREARRLAGMVERAAERLPLSSDCLPRAMALSWILRKKRLAHAVVFAVRPADLRVGRDALHAWVEVDGSRIIGDLPGPWLETLRLGAAAPGTAHA